MLAVTQNLLSVNSVTSKFAFSLLTPKLQPRDLGIIKSFKIYYRHLFLRYVLSKIDECDKASDVVKSIIALRWTAKAWAQVKPETIIKCFRKAGILKADLDVISCELGGDDDPFLDADMHTEVQDLIEQTMHGFAVHLRCSTQAL